MGIAPSVPIADQLVVREEVREVVALLDRLRPADAEILRLAAWEQLNTAQVADVLGLTPDATKQRLSRTRKRSTRMHEKENSTNRNRHGWLFGRLDQRLSLA